MSQDNSALKIARNIASWLTQMPASAVRLEVRQRHAIGGQQETLLAFDCQKIRENVEGGSIEQIASSAYRETANYAEAQQQECIFVAQFLDQIGAPIATTQWRIGSVFGDAAERPFDGSVQSMMSQNQTHIHAVLGMHLQGMDTMQKGYKEIIAILQRRISELEDRLFKAEKARVDSKADPNASEIELAMLTLENEQESRRVQQFFDGVGQIAAAIREPKALPSSAGAGTTGSSASSSTSATTSAPSSTPAETTAAPSQPGTSDSAPVSSGASSDASPAAQSDSAPAQPPAGSAP